MKILGIDPGSRKTGYGLIELGQDGRSLVAIDYGVFYLDTTAELSERMADLANRLTKLIEKQGPQNAVLEEVFVSESPRSALILGQSRGAALAVCGLHALPVASIATTKVKQHVTGNGHASKQQVGEMVRILLKLNEKPAEDAADALALAICFASMQRLQLMSKKPVKKQKSKRQALFDLARAQGKI